VNGPAPGFAIMLRPQPARVHPRVNRALKSIPERLGESTNVSLKTLAAIAGLSPSRFMHVFTESVGVPLRPYILSLRLQRACSELMAGATITSAACNAGFSDAAHLNRTFRKMLGMTPSDFALRVRMSGAFRSIELNPDPSQINRNAGLSRRPKVH